MERQERARSHEDDDSDEESAEKPDGTAERPIEPGQADPFEKLRGGVAEKRPDDQNSGEDPKIAQEICDADRTGIFPQWPPRFGIVQRGEKNRENRGGHSNADASESLLKAGEDRDQKDHAEHEVEQVHSFLPVRTR